MKTVSVQQHCSYKNLGVKLSLGTKSRLKKVFGYLLLAGLGDYFKVKMSFYFIESLS